MDWLRKIGEEARLLDERSLKDRIKIGKKSFLKIFVAIFFYLIVLTLFYYFL